MLDMSSRKQRKRIKSMYKDNNTLYTEITEDMLIKCIKKICSKPPNKEPIIIISNGLTDEQINEIINFKTN